MGMHQGIAMKNRWNKMHVQHLSKCLAQIVLAAAIPRPRSLLLLLRRILLLYSCLKGSQMCLNQRGEVAKFFICEQFYFNHQQIPDTLVTNVRTPPFVVGSCCQNDHNRMAISNVWNTTFSLASQGQPLVVLNLSLHQMMLGVAEAEHSSWKEWVIMKQGGATGYN